MKVRFYIDAETGQPHIHRHNVSEQEADDVLRRPLEHRAGRDGSRVALGQTRGKLSSEPDAAFWKKLGEIGPDVSKRRQGGTRWGVESTFQSA